MNRRLRLLVLVAVLAATAIAIARSNPAAIGHALARMSWRWATAAAILNLAGVVIDAARLRIIVGALGRVAMLRVVQAQLVGIVGNVLFPFKLGDGARAYALARKHEVPGATALTMVVLDRIIDALALPMFVVIASIVLPLPSEVLRYRTWMLTLSAAGSAAGVVIGWRLRDRRAARRVPLAGAGALDRIIDGVAILGHRGRLLSAIGASLLSWTARAAIVWCMLHASDLTLPLSATVSTLVIVNLGIAVIATPGNVGTFELATAAALALWGVPPQTGLSVGIATHVVEVVSSLALGFVVGGWSLVVTGANRQPLTAND